MVCLCEVIFPAHPEVWRAVQPGLFAQFRFGRKNGNIVWMVGVAGGVVNGLWNFDRYRRADPDRFVHLWKHTVSFDRYVRRYVLGAVVV